MIKVRRKVIITFTCLLLVPMFVYFVLEYQSDKQKTLSIVGYSGRLGNQLWWIFVGMCVAEQLNRTFAIYNDTLDPAITSRIELVTNMLPKVKNNIMIKSSYDVEIQHFTETGIRNITKCCLYKDPMIHSTRTENHILLDMRYFQNMLYLQPCLNTIRPLFTCSEELQQRVRIIREEYAISGPLLCAHVRRTDFVKIGWAKDDKTEYRLVSYVAKKMGRPRLLLMGDDRKYMKKLMNTLERDGIVNTTSVVSTFSPEEDLCLASTVCTNTVLTVQGSTFGHWLGFMQRNQISVYYPEEKIRRGVPYMLNVARPWNIIPLEEKEDSL